MALLTSGKFVDFSEDLVKFMTSEVVGWRMLLKRILRKYGYPPDLQDAAIQTGMGQVVAVTGQWAA